MRGQERAFFLFLVPVLVFFAVFRYAPVLIGVWVSLWDYSLLRGFQRFAGLEHYITVFTDPGMLSAVWITVRFAVGKVVVEVIIGLALSLLLVRSTRVNALIRSVLFVPVVTSSIVLSVIWAMLYNSQSGLINSVLMALGLPPQPFLTSTSQALGSLIGMGVWSTLGLTVIILVVGLGQIDQALYEAAAVDGASVLRRFWHVTLPGLRGPIAFVAAMHTIEAIQVFVPMYNMTNGGPQGSTTSIALFVYKQGFEYGNMGYASAISIVVVLVIVLISGGQLAAWRRKLGRRA